MPAEQQGSELTCKHCTKVMAFCAFCERHDCPRPICYGCLRIQLGQSMAHLHTRGPMSTCVG